MTIIEDTRVINRPPFDTAPVEQPARAGPSRKRRVLAAGTAIAIAVGLAAVAAETVTSNEDDETRTTSPISDHVVIGVGPHAVYVGPAPDVGGDPIPGESDESYFARTGRHLPGLSSALLVEAPWWYGPAPEVGGDPVPGESDESYFARTGRHLPGSISTVGE